MTNPDTKLQQVLSLIPALNNNQLKTLKSVLDSTLKVNAKVVLTPDQLAFYKEVIDLFRSLHIGNVPDKEGVKPTPTMRGFNIDEFMSAYDCVNSVFDHYSKDKDIRKRYKFYRIAVSSAHHFIKGDYSNFYAKDLLEAVEVLDELVLANNDEDGESIEEALDSIKKIARKLKSKPTQLGLSPLLIACSDIRSCLDMSFPGYLKAGLLPVILADPITDYDPLKGYD